MFQPKNAPIAIVGGGPAGLTLARLLEISHIEYVVYERDASPDGGPHYQGGTLDLHRDTGQAALRRAGLDREFEKLARRDATTLTVQDDQGGSLTRIGEGRDAPEIDRLQLRNLLLGSIPKHRVQWGKTISHVELDKRRETIRGGRATIHFTDGSKNSQFCLVVGADGSRSKIRPLITSSKPKYVGKMFIEGRIKHENSQYGAALDMVGAGNSLAMGVERILCVQQLADRSYRVYMGIKAPEHITRPGGDADLADMERARNAMLGSGGYFADWAPHLRAFIVHAEGPWRAWPWNRIDPDVFERPSEPTANEDGNQASKYWTRTQGVTLIGDAAHASSPNGEGVNEAMHDALMLFECIVAEIKDCSGFNSDQSHSEDARADAEPLERAVTAYEAKMLPRAAEYIRRCISDEKKMFSPKGLREFRKLLDEVS